MLNVKAKVPNKIYMLFLNHLIIYNPNEPSLYLKKQQQRMKEPIFVGKIWGKHLFITYKDIK